MTVSREEYLPGTDGAAIREREGVALVNRPLEGIGHGSFTTLSQVGNVNDQVEFHSPPDGVAVSSGVKFKHSLANE